MSTTRDWWKKGYFVAADKRCFIVTHDLIDSGENLLLGEHWLPMVTLTGELSFQISHCKWGIA